MAITTTTIYAAAGYARTDVINQIESAFNWLGFNAGPVSGMVTMQSGTSGGGTATGDYQHSSLYNLPQKSTSGSGTGATFDVYRSSGSVYRVRPNRPGSGYAQNDTITIDAADMGTGATDLIVTVQVDGNASPTAYGSATTLFHKENAVGTNYPYGVTRHTVGVGKTYGDTYRAYDITSNTQLQIRTGSSFSPFKTATQYENYGGYYLSPGFRGDEQFDMPNDNDSISPVDSTTSQSSSGYHKTIEPRSFASSSTYPLQLNIFRSGIDTKFAVLSFREGTKPATTLEDNTYFTWFVHNYDSSLFDYDYLFQGGITEIFPDTNSGYEELYWRSYHGEVDNTNSMGIGAMRSAEFGFTDSYNNHATNYKETIYGTTSPTNNRSTSWMDGRHVGCYYRDNTHTVQGRSDNSFSSTSVNYKKLEDATNYNAVIKGLPLNALYAPCPYYIPDDFAMINFDYASPGANIQQGDTVTISGSEIWTVITGSYTQTTRTRGILFCARTT